MKIKVATTFSLRNDGQDSQNSERFVSSALAIDPEGTNDQSDEACHCGTGTENHSTDCIENQQCVKKASFSKNSNVIGKKIPRFMIFGKPGSGKSDLAEQICKQFGCSLLNINAILRNEPGSQSNEIIVDDKIMNISDVDDYIILELLKQKISSEECTLKGYVIDGLPTQNEKKLPIEKQLNEIFSMANGPEYIIDIKAPKDEMCVKDNVVQSVAQAYSSATFSSADSGVCINALQTAPSDVPNVSKLSSQSVEAEQRDAMERPAETKFVQEICEKVEEFISKRDPAAVINVDIRASSDERFKQAMCKLKQLHMFDFDQPPDNTGVEDELFQSLVDVKCVFGADPPRVILVGKPCAGKSTLGGLLCKAWGCHYLNVSDLIMKYFNEDSQRGREMRAAMERGEEVPEAIIFSIVNEELEQEGVLKDGYVLDGMPSYSQRPNSVQMQLDFLVNIHPSPKYWIVIEMDDNVIRAQNMKIRFDQAASRLSSLPSQDLSDNDPPAQLTNFPSLDQETGAILLSSHDDMSETMEKRFYFYDQYVAEPLEIVLHTLPPSSVIRLRRPLDVADMLHDTVHKLREACGLPRLTILRTLSSATTPPAVPEELVGSRDIWKHHIPRMVFVGKPCSGKTTLARLIADAWACEHVNAPELIEEHWRKRDHFGEQIVAHRKQGQEIPDSLLFDIVNAKLQTPECQTNGYILEDIPDFRGPLKNADAQLQWLNKLSPEPLFWVVVEISDEDLRARWEAVRINHANAVQCSDVCTSKAPHSANPCDFPFIDEETKRLLAACTDKEGIEKIKAHVKFYNENVVIPLEQFLERFDPASIVYLNAVRPPEQLAKELKEIIQYRIDSWPNGIPPEKYPYADAELPSKYRAHFSKPSLNDSSIEAKVPASLPVQNLQAFDQEVGADFVAGSLPAQQQQQQQQQQQYDKPMAAQTLEHTPEPCCCQCGANFLVHSAKLWENRVPRILIIGKPCTGKTALAKMMSEAWGCQLINASELVREHLTNGTPFGKRIEELLLNGRDLDDQLVINIVAEKLHSSAARWNGYVLDDFPTYSEKSLTVPRQLEFLASLNPPPEYVIHLQMPDDLLRSRWEKVKIDLKTGLLHVEKLKCKKSKDHSANPPSCCMLPSASMVKANPVEGYLITRHEELTESMDANITFYHEVVEPQLLDWVHKHFPNRMINLEADLAVFQIFQVLQRKLEVAIKNKDRPLDQIFTDKENSFVPGSCCNRCGMRYANLEPMPDLWTEFPPRFIIFGKPCTGKTSLARRMCNLWNCQLVNASDLIAEHLSRNSSTGQQIRAIMNSGHDLSDEFVINMLNEKLASPACAESGYVIDGIPTHSEKSQSIEHQMEFLESLHPKPDYVVDIRIADSDLRSRWETVRIDVEDGALYVSEMYGQKFSHHGEPNGRLIRHPDFPPVDEQTKQRLITRHEELPENLDKHFPFYNAYITPQVEKFVQSHDSSKVIVLNADMTPTKMLNTLLYKLHVMALNPGVPTSGLFPEDHGATLSEASKSHCCQVHYPTAVQPLEDLWLDKPPRVMILGKPCSGKTTLAKRLCAAWGCELVNASHMVATELASNSTLGQHIRTILTNGPDLPDSLVLHVIQSLITSPKCIENGYVLDGIPTHSELSMSIEQQLQMLRSMDNGPEYIIEIQIDDDDLRNRWQDIRIDFGSGMLYTKMNYDNARTSVSGRTRRVRHPDFPVVDDSVKERLLTRHEELPENLNLHFEFYHNRLEAPLKQFIDSHDPAAVVRVKGNVSPTELLQSVLQRLSVMARHPGVPTSVLFKRSSIESSASDASSCPCQCAEGPTHTVNLWKNNPPKILILGNSCSGKTTLARKLAKDWDCNLVNATDLILQRMASKTTLGDHIRRTMSSGQDLPDQLVLDLLRDKLGSGDCIERGYILDDFPTSSEKAMSVNDQLNMLLELACSPSFIIDIQLSEEDLKKRWESIRIDLADGALYPERSFVINDSAESTHPAFPTSNENLRQRLITRHEELVENIQKQTEFYSKYVRPQIDQFLDRCYKGRVIRIDGMNRSKQQCHVITKAIQEHHQRFGDC